MVLTAPLWAQDWSKDLATAILDVIDAVETPPAVWWPIHDALVGFSDTVDKASCTTACKDILDLQV